MVSFYIWFGENRMKIVFWIQKLWIFENFTDQLERILDEATKFWTEGKVNTTRWPIQTKIGFKSTKRAL